VVDVSSFCQAGISETQGEDRASAQQRTLRAWDDAFSKFGFCYLEGHGVDLSLIARLESEARTFFALPQTEKERINLGKGYGHGGFVPMGIESRLRAHVCVCVLSGACPCPGVARSRAARGEAKAARADPVESLSFHHGGTSPDVAPSHPEGLQRTVQEYCVAMRTLLAQLMRISACALLLPPDFFEESFVQPGVFLRLASYPPPAEPTPYAAERYGAHTDYTGFTILWPDPQIGGLEVFVPQRAGCAEGQWVACPPRRGAFVVNAGDLIARWTNDHWVSNLHRVVSLPAPASLAEPPAREQLARLSLVYFTGPRGDTVCSCLPSPLCAPESPRYPAISANEHLQTKLQRTSLHAETAPAETSPTAVAEGVAAV
jgi:isopenicillin N synthase-like dioxygenase